MSDSTTFHVLRVLRLIASGLVVVASFTSGTSGAAREPQADTRCEVVVLGIDHVYYGEGYRPAHLRAFFAAVKPTAIAIENPPSFQAVNELRLPLYEAKEALAYGTSHKVPVYGVDWDPVDAPARPTRGGWEQAIQARRLPQTSIQVLY